MVKGERLSAQWLTQHIRENIPLSEAMRFEIAEIGEHSIEVIAPLEPNINLHGTGFAGSLYSLAVLTAWGLTSALVAESGMVADVVVSKAEIRYKRPVKSAIRCVCETENKATFIESLVSKGRGRLQLSVKIGENEEALLIANMVASKRS